MDYRDPRVRPDEFHGTVYINATGLNRCAKRGYDQPVRAQLVCVLKPWNLNLWFSKMHTHGPRGNEYAVMETLGVATPRPGKVPPNAGHWRVNNETKVVAGETVLRAASRPKPPPRLQPRPTGGKTDQPRVSHTPPKRKRSVKPKNTEPTMIELHSMWALGEDVCDGILEATAPNNPRKGVS